MRAGDIAVVLIVALGVLYALNHTGAGFKLAQFRDVTENHGLGVAVNAAIIDIKALFK